MCKRYINEQVRFYTTSINFLQSQIIEEGIIFDSVILKDEIPSSDISAVQYSVLLRSMKEKAVENGQNILSRIIGGILL